MDAISRERIERCARLYASSKAAAQALGIAPQSFGRLCRRYGIDPPQRRRRRQEQRARALARQVYRVAMEWEE